MFADTRKVVAYVLANNLSADIYDESLSESEVNIPPVTISEGATPMADSPVASPPSTQTMLTNTDTHVRTLFTSSTTVSSCTPTTMSIAAPSLKQGTSNPTFSFMSDSSGRTTEPTTGDSTLASGVNFTTSGITSSPTDFINVLTTATATHVSGCTTSVPALANNFSRSVSLNSNTNSITVGSSKTLVSLLQAERAAVSNTSSNNVSSVAPVPAPPGPVPPLMRVAFARPPQPGIPAQLTMIPRGQTSVHQVQFITPSNRPQAPIPQPNVPTHAPPQANATNISPPQSGQDSSALLLNIQQMFQQHTESVKQEINQIREEVASRASAPPLAVSLPSPTMPTLTEPPSTQANNAHLSPPTLTPIEENIPSKNPTPTATRQTVEGDLSSGKLATGDTTVSLIKGPMGATPIKRRPHKSSKRPLPDESSPSPTDSDSGSDYGRKRTKKAKSGAFRTYSDRVKMTFRWPNEYIGREDGSSPTYDQLSYSELVCGIFRGLVRQLPRLAANFSIEQQLKYYAAMFYEAPTQNFDNARMAHRIVLEALEKKDIVSEKWEDWDIKRQQVVARLHRATPAPPKPANNAHNASNNKKAKGPKPLRPTPCEYWNGGTCNITAAEHPGTRVMWLHVCTTCFIKGERNKHKDKDSTCPYFAQAASIQAAAAAAKNAKGPNKGAQ